jgi:alanine dehydrogenase
MYYVSESVVQQTVSQEQVTAAVEHAYTAYATGDAVNFPVVRETLDYADAIFGFKSGFDKSGPVLGVKAGGLWPGNRAKGLANHQSTICLFDAETGSPHALVRGTYLTALRTAAASALSIRHLAKNDAERLGIVGAGGQSEYQIRAALSEREFRTIRIADHNRDQAGQLKQQLDDIDGELIIVDPETMAKESDVIITVTPSREPILKADWIQPGTHLACMGADTKGKHEVDVEIVSNASVFGDDPAQAVTIGEKD